MHTLFKGFKISFIKTYLGSPTIIPKPCIFTERFNYPDNSNYYNSPNQHNISNIIFIKVFWC